MPENFQSSLRPRTGAGSTDLPIDQGGLRRAKFGSPKDVMASTLSFSFHSSAPAPRSGPRSELARLSAWARASGAIDLALRASVETVWTLAAITVLCAAPVALRFEEAATEPLVAVQTPGLRPKQSSDPLLAACHRPSPRLSAPDGPGHSQNSGARLAITAGMSVPGSLLWIDEDASRCDQDVL